MFNLQDSFVLLTSYVISFNGLWAAGCTYKFRMMDDLAFRRTVYETVVLL